MPTLCEMAGVPLPAQGIQGRSMTKLVAGTEKDCPPMPVVAKGRKQPVAKEDEQ